MGTLVETEEMEQATALLVDAHRLLTQLGALRVYATAKFDCREGPLGRLEGKTASVQRRRRGAMKQAGSGGRGPGLTGSPGRDE
jgi:uncharacterized protein YqgV (UPF0045/DUF77 family)